MLWPLIRRIGLWLLVGMRSLWLPIRSKMEETVLRGQSNSVSIHRSLHHLPTKAILS